MRDFKVSLSIGSRPFIGSITLTFAPSLTLQGGLAVPLASKTVCPTIASESSTERVIERRAGRSAPVVIITGSGDEPHHKIILFLSYTDSLISLLGSTIVPSFSRTLS